MPGKTGPSPQVLRTLEKAPSSYLILSPELYILTASDVYLEATETERKNITGKHIFDAFPDNPDWPEADGVQNINESVQIVLRTRKPHKMRIQKYDVPDTQNPGKFIERYWDPSHTPILDEKGEISYIIQLANNITDKVLFDRKNVALEELLTQLAESQNKTNDIVRNAPFPIGVYIGREMRIEFANPSMLEVWGKGNDVIGKLYTQVLPELDNQEVFAQLDRVFLTGKPFHARNQRLDLVVGGKLQAFYFNYSFTPLLDAAGKIYGVMNTAADVSDVVNAKNRLEENEQELQAANEELISINEEQSATNEELSQAQGQLQTMISELHQTNLRLYESESDFKRMVEQAPVAILVFRGPELVVDQANKGILEILGKDNSIIGRPLLEAMPELKGEPAVELLFDIYHKGISSEGNEVPVRMLGNGEMETRYFNFSYRPLKDGEHIIGVMDVAVEVTGQVLARQAIEWGEEQLRLAIDSAELATWYLDAATGEFLLRCQSF